MKKFQVIVLLPETEQDEDKDLRLVALEDESLLIGRSLTYAGLLSRCGKEDAGFPGFFAVGICENEEIIFRHMTPGWKRDDVRDFLAGQAPLLLMEVVDLKSQIFKLQNQVAWLKQEH